MTFLITGATGFVGRRIAEMLLEDGKSVRAFVRTPAKANDLAASGAEVVAGDLLDADSVARAVDGADVILHCGASIAPGMSAQVQFSTNVEGVRNVFEAVRRSGRGRLVSVSSAMVLGTRDLRPAYDDTPPRAANDAGADSKIEAERLARQYMTNGVDAVIIRPPLIYGPGDPYNIPKFAKSIEDGTFRYVKSRDNVVPIVHVDDISRAVILAGTVDGPLRPVYNVTDGTATTAGQFIGRIAQCLGVPEPTKVVPFIVPQLLCEASERLAGLLTITPKIDRVDLRFFGTHREFDISGARRDLGYVPQKTCLEGIAETVEWYRGFTRTH